MFIGFLGLYIGNDGLEFDEIDDGTDVSFINTEINKIEMEICMINISKAGFLSLFLSVSFPTLLWRLVFLDFLYFIYLNHFDK